MFKDLFNLEKKRVKGEVFGFYLFYMIIGAIIGGFGSAMIGRLFLGTNASFEEGLKLGKLIGPIIGSLYAFVLSLYIIINKNIFKNFKAILLLILSVVLTGSLGGLIGFIPVSILTTIEPNKSEELPK